MSRLVYILRKSFTPLYPLSEIWCFSVLHMSGWMSMTSSELIIDIMLDLRLSYMAECMIFGETLLKFESVRHAWLSQLNNDRFFYAWRRWQHSKHSKCC